jgi:hypothetical protein
MLLVRRSSKRPFWPSRAVPRTRFAPCALEAAELLLMDAETSRLVQRYYVTSDSAGGQCGSGLYMSQDPSVAGQAPAELKRDC